ncbi:MAG TPA: fumarylacetoacetate hydrolase family protein [Ottowia sp.]|uniref:fumarylacetoacetate hydrolase family protein n=1 Tax=Ottowia sp. TaxID=1898956 RepID=UPI002B7E550C|nr:fumarylacetoacetate hydrolase family protein [Ottowia sp.]HMN22002.1 fumarylacetoacetate hydrolase family protein [Ottowia sp.]
MKLATYKDGSRDGQLVVVSRDLASAHYATGIASRLQQVLDDWNFMAPQLQDLSDALNAGRARHAFAFEPACCMAPLPRACQRVEGAAYLSHVELVCAGGLGGLSERLAAGPLVRQAASDALLGARDDIVAVDEAHGIDFAGALAVITGDVPIGATPEQGLEAVRLLMLASDVSLRELMAREMETRLGLLQGKPATAYGPVALTPDELGSAWQDGRVHLALQTSWNGRKLGLCDAGPEMRFHFGELIAHAARTRCLGAGTIVGSGPVSNHGVESGGRREWPRGHGCIAEKRALETLQDGAPSTGYLKFGDTVRVEMKGRDGRSLFGAIEQKVVPLARG